MHLYNIFVWLDQLYCGGVLYKMWEVLVVPTPKAGIFRIVVYSMVIDVFTFFLQLFIWSPSAQAPVQSYTDHTAAIKAIAWSPHQHGILASGGGTADRTIRFRNTITGQALQSIDTGSQVHYNTRCLYTILRSKQHPASLVPRPLPAFQCVRKRESLGVY